MAQRTAGRNGNSIGKTTVCLDKCQQSLIVDRQREIEQSARVQGHSQAQDLPWTNVVVQPQELIEIRDKVIFEHVEYPSNETRSELSHTSIRRGSTF